MTTMPPDVRRHLRDAVAAAALRPDVVRAVDTVYDDLRDQVGQRRPRCDASGRCCRFEEFGHRLYVTTLELAAFLNGLPAHNPDPAAAMDRWDDTGCPFQSLRLCTVHAIRPFGCRIFFCDPTAAQWQQDQYERFHARLKRLHGELHVPYFYVEWRDALRALLPARVPPTPNRP